MRSFLLQRGDYLPLSNMIFGDCFLIIVKILYETCNSNVDMYGSVDGCGEKS